MSKPESKTCLRTGFVCIISVSLCQYNVSTLGTGLSPRPSVSQSVGLSVCPESVLWQNGWVDADAVLGGGWGWSRDGCIRWGGYRWEWIWASHRNQWGYSFCNCARVTTLPKLLWEDLLLIIFCLLLTAMPIWQSCVQFRSWFHLLLQFHGV